MATLDAVWRTISFGVGRRNDEVAEHRVLDAIEHAEIPMQRAMFQTARSQLGTVGGGNHYVDLLGGDDGFLWIGVHFGSRGFGFKTCNGFTNLGTGRHWGDKTPQGNMDAPPLLLDVRTALGQDYIEAMQLAGRYAWAGREWVVARVLRLLGTEATYTVHNHHNLAWLEEHDGRMLWVARKGATPANPGQEGFVGGSMGDDSVILRGVASPESVDGLYSTIHGAGRIMSRNEAAGKKKYRKDWRCSSRDCDHTAPARDHQREKDGALPKCPKCQTRMRRHTWTERLPGGKIDWAAVSEDLANQGIVIRGGSAEEAPGTYKRLPEVIAAHGGTVELVHVLHPLGVAMASDNVFDPFKE